MFLFNLEQITRVYALGYQDEEQMAFKRKQKKLLMRLESHKYEKEIKYYFYSNSGHYVICHGMW